MDHPNARLLLSTFADEESALSVLRQLLEERLIACGTLIPGVRSLYRWKGKIEEASEVFVLMKTDQKNASRCMSRIQELHPYEVPELILLDLEAVADPYALWIREALEKSKGEN